MSVHPVKPGLESHRPDNQEVKGSFASIISALAKQPLFYLTSSTSRPLSSSNWVWAVNNPGSKTGPTPFVTPLSLKVTSQVERIDKKREDQRRSDRRVLDQYIQDFFHGLQETFKNPSS